MPASYRAQTKSRNSRPDHPVVNSLESGSRSAKSLALFQDVLRRLIRDTWPETTAKNLAAAGDVTVRQAERIMARQKKISFEVFWNLMEHEQFGSRFHWAILDHLTSKWSALQRRDREYVAIQNEKRLLDQREEQWRRRTS